MYLNEEWPVRFIWCLFGGVLNWPLAGRLCRNVVYLIMIKYVLDAHFDWSYFAYALGWIKNYAVNK
jgi:hypothetical protein